MKCNRCIHYNVCLGYRNIDIDGDSNSCQYAEERPQGECKTCRYHDSEDKKCDCGISDDMKRLITVLLSKSRVITTKDVEFIAGVISENEWIQKNNPNVNPNSIIGAVANGIHLSEGHEDLIAEREDAKAYSKAYVDGAGLERLKCYDFSLAEIIREMERLADKGEDICIEIAQVRHLLVLLKELAIYRLKDTENE